MWDVVFSSQNREIKTALEGQDGSWAFELMHRELDKVWGEVFRVLKPGGVACINIGDATSSVAGHFQWYTSHARIAHHYTQLGFHTLHSNIWRKQTNAPNKFIGSGILPVVAYVTLEHEQILVLRRGWKRVITTSVENANRQKRCGIDTGNRKLGLPHFISDPVKR